MGVKDLAAAIEAWQTARADIAAQVERDDTEQARQAALALPPVQPSQPSTDEPTSQEAQE